MLLDGVRVFLVEDESLLLMLAEATLESFGAVIVATASSLGEALVEAERVTADIAILDINLSGEMSYPAADILARRDIPVVFVTGYANLALPTAFQAAPRLTKPYNENRLVEVIREVANVART
jgi:CheY-like chemotaxis protein